MLYHNPARNISVKKGETRRTYLTKEEIIKLYNTECENKELKNAFIFACYAGLRFSDIFNLKINNVQNGSIIFKQKKTKQVEKLKLHPVANKIFQEQKKNKAADSYVFIIKYCADKINRIIRNWVEKAGIEKHVTFHVARHTFATLLLTYDVDIYTVSKLLGHKDLKTTEIYAKLIDKKRDEAIDKLPNL